MLSSVRHELPSAEVIATPPSVAGAFDLVFLSESTHAVRRTGGVFTPGALVRRAVTFAPNRTATGEPGLGRS